MNFIHLVGRLVREAESRDLEEGKTVFSNTLAVQRRYRTEQGQPVDFIPFVAWGKTAKRLSTYCEKGHLIGISGRMQSRSYVNKEEETIFVIEMVVDEVYFLQSKKKDAGE